MGWKLDNLSCFIICSGISTSCKAKYEILVKIFINNRFKQPCGGLWSPFRSDPTNGQRSSRIQIALEMPYGLVGRTPDQSIMHSGSQRLCRVIWGQPGVKLLRNALWLLRLVGRTLDQSVVRQRSFKGQPGVTLLRKVLWQQNLVGKTLDQSVLDW